MRLIARALIALCLLLGPAEAWALPPVWVVRHGGETMVLFGSVHVLPPDVDWRPATLKQALAQADDVWFEAPMDQAGLDAATAAASAHAVLPPGQRLSALLSPRARKRLARTAALFGVPVDTFEDKQPWYAELMIEDALFQRLDLEGKDGVEQQLWGGLSPSAKRVALETPAQQIGFFADAPLKEQVASLEQTLKDVPNAKRDYDVLLKAWLNGDVRTLERQVLDPLRKSSPGLYRRVVSERNARWVKAIDARLEGKGETVVVVGMGHLIGPGGLPARLRAQGYRVDGPR